MKPPEHSLRIVLKYIYHGQNTFHPRPNLQSTAFFCNLSAPVLCDRVQSRSSVRSCFIHTTSSPLIQPHILSTATRKTTMEGAPQNTMEDTPLSFKYAASTEYSKDAEKYEVPYVNQDPQETAQLLRALEGSGKHKNGISCKKTRYAVAGSRDGIQVDSWRFQDWDYKKRDLPTYARGLFTTKNSHGVPEIAIRGYDKFFNTGEVHATEWDNILTRTKGPYELTLKENGCIIFISGLEDDTLLVCSKHSTGDRADVTVSHASAGEKRVAAQLARVGKTTQDLARELRKRNATAVAELCDDSFEEHILAYGPDSAGLYLHGININIPEFMTYPSPLVQKFAEDWGFVKTGLIVIDDITEVKAFLEEVAETGAHGGRDVEGFVIRCKMSHDPAKQPFQDWFFKYKFEEPYLMYRQWRECTKQLIAGKQPRFRKHAKITEEYLLYARKRLAADRTLAKLYNMNHGIIKLRNDFLEFKNMKGSDAANFEALYGGGGEDVTGDVILVPIATIGCGKTTIGLALTHLFGWGHIQNDNITGAKRPPRFTKAVLDSLDETAAVFADRNNAQKHERKQLITDVKIAHAKAKMVALHFVHNDIDTIRKITQERVFDRGDNHQTIQAASDMSKVRGIMEGFINRFEPCDTEKEPDSGFDAVIDLDPTAGSRTNLEVVLNKLHELYPKFVTAVPTAQDMDEAIKAALEGYKPDLRHTIPDRGPRGKNKQQQQQPKYQDQQAAHQQKKKKPLEYMSVDVATKDILAALEKTFAPASNEASRFWKQLQGSRRVQPRFHVTLMHRASAKEHPELWDRYKFIADSEGATTADGRLGEMEVLLERVVYDDRIMAIVVRLVPSAEDANINENSAGPAKPKWECVNRVAHITIGTRDDSVKPKESNDLLARWLEAGSSPETKISDLVIEGKPLVKGTVKGVLSR
ncbi:fungal tRNA ligase phosphodiesterase domain-containing protein [Cercophora newfieldiana]|uniref:Fungal tRNA ligase phosphodiesterase domain-containing protein n=1 Tax=Cercophora newfieldiana TaxID=92897 RepID=A0AA39XZZ3_9PEZI|nr:fungal tRNA ligase phosphodiesterase domain-containing protein [Cercophora newfieldiana]